MHVQSTASANKVTPLWRFSFFLMAQSKFSLLLGGTTVTDGRGGGRGVGGETGWVGGWITGRQPVGAAPMEWSSVRVTSRRCAQPIHNSKWPVIRGRKALEMILRDQREEAEPRWSARPPPGDKPPLLCLQQLTSGGCYICMRDFGKTHLMLRIYAGWYREISGSECGRLRL